MKLTVKTLLPVGLILLLSSCGMIFFFQFYLEQQLLEDFFIGHSDKATRDAEQFLTDEDFSNSAEPVSQQHFLTFFHAMNLTEIAHIVVWNTSGQIIATTDQASEKHNMEPGESQRIAEVFRTREPLFNKHNGDASEEADASESAGLSSYDYETYVPIFFGGKIKGITELQLSTIFITQIIKRIAFMAALLFGLVFLAVFSVIAYLLHRFVVAPVDRIVDASSALQAGIWDIPASDRQRKDEIGGLALSFEHMRTTLQKSFQELKDKQKSAERDRKEIMQKNKELEDSKKAMLNILEDFKEVQAKERLAHESVAQQKERAESILNYLQSIAEAVFATDTSGHIVFINRTAEALLPEKRQDSLMLEKAHEIFQFVEGEGKQKKPVFPVMSSLEHSSPFKFPKKSYLHTRQKDIPVDGICSPFTREGKNLGAICVFQDITERYNLEREKDDFLSIAAHQLRTPLAGIRWMIESLLEGDDGELPLEAKNTLDQIYENNQRLVVLVNDLLDVSKINMGKSKEEPASVNICKILKETVENQAGPAKERGVSVSYEKICALNPIVKIGPKHLFQAMENLLSNAVKYTPEGGSVKVSADFKENGVIISISDTGIGIPKNEQENIFKKFFRASNAALKETEGSGLGLNVVKSFIEEAGGRIWFESREGEGTTFFVKLPAA